MSKYIKYIFSFLLIYGLTVNECSIYSQVNSSNYHQVVYVTTKKDVSYKHLKLYDQSVQTLSERVSPFQIYPYLQDNYSSQILVILKSQSELYQKVFSIKAQHVFLSKIITSSNHYPSLYIA